LLSESALAWSDFTTIRSEFVVKNVAEALAEPGLSAHHVGLRILGRVYAHDAATLPTFLRLIYEQIKTQSAIFDDEIQQEGFICRAFLSMAKAFVGGLKGGTCPQGPNPLDSSPPDLQLAPAPMQPRPASQTIAAAVSVGAPPPAGAQVTSLTPLPMAPAYGNPAFAPPPLYQTVSNPNTGTQNTDLETYARQVATGFRESGPLYKGWAGGGQEGLDLTHGRVPQP